MARSLSVWKGQNPWEDLARCLVGLEFGVPGCEAGGDKVKNKRFELEHRLRVCDFTPNGEPSKVSPGMRGTPR